MQSVTQEKDFEHKSTETRIIMGIVGSPRKGCNTETLVDSVLAGANEYGAISEKVFLHDLRIAPCRACDSCQKTGRCIQKDDMETLLPIMQKSDIWVLGTPIYWWGPSAQLKAFIDRWYGLDQRMFQGKRIVLTIPMGGGDSRYARHAIGMMKDICNYLGMEFVESVVAPGMDGRMSAKSDNHLLEDARIAGLKAMRSFR